MMNVQDFFSRFTDNPKAVDEILREADDDPAWQVFMNIFFHHSQVIQDIYLESYRNDFDRERAKGEIKRNIAIFDKIFLAAWKKYEDFEKILSETETRIDIMERWGEDVSNYRKEFQKIQSFFYSINETEFLWLMADELAEVISVREWRREIHKHAKKFTKKVVALESWIQAYINQLYYHFENKEKLAQKEKRRQEKQEREQKMKNEKTEKVLVLASENTSIPTWLLDKIGAFEVRVNNIFSLVEENGMNVKIQNEIQQIAIDLEKIRQKTVFPEVLEAIQNIQKIIDIIKNTKEKTAENMQIFPQKSEEIEIKKENYALIKPSENNAHLIEIFEKILKNFDYTISSTRHKRDDSYGDGSFVMKIFRPFIQGLLHEVFMKNNIIVWSDISWNEIIQAYELRVENKDRAQNHFYGILKNSYKNCADLRELFEELRVAIVEFSLSDFFDKGKEKSLKNFLKKFDEFLQREFPQK